MRWSVVSVVSGVRERSGTRGYLGPMRDLCMRSACLGTADVLVMMDVKELTFTVFDLDEVGGPGAVVLCDVHLDRLKAPKGWALVDERTGGNLIQLPERPITREEAADRIVGPVADVAPIRPVEAAVHPLASARTARSRPESAQMPSAAETPMLARAFLGVDRHPAVPSDESDPAVDPFGDQSWDQRDQREVLDEQDDDGQFIFGGEPGA